MFYPFVVMICYIIVTLIKRTSLAKEWLPLISAGIGAALAILGFCIVPQLVTEETILTAVFNGAISGLAATGGNQVVKQAIKLFCKQHGLDYHVVKTCLPTSETNVHESDSSRNLACEFVNTNGIADNKYE